MRGRFSYPRWHARRVRELGQFGDSLAFADESIEGLGSSLICVVFYEEYEYFQPMNNLFLPPDSRDQPSIPLRQTNPLLGLILLLVLNNHADFQEPFYQ